MRIRVNGTAVFAVASSGLTTMNVNATEADNDTQQSLIVSTTSVSVNEGQHEYVYRALGLTADKRCDRQRDTYIGRYGPVG